MKRFINWVLTGLSAVLWRFGISAGPAPPTEKTSKAEFQDAPQPWGDGAGCNSAGGGRTPADVNGAEADETHETGEEQGERAQRGQCGTGSSAENREAAFAGTLDAADAGALGDAARTGAPEKAAALHDRPKGGREPVEAAADEEQEPAPEAGSLGGVLDAEHSSGESAEESPSGGPLHAEARGASAAPVCGIEELRDEAGTSTSEASSAPAPTEAAANAAHAVSAGHADQITARPEEHAAVESEPTPPRAPVGESAVTGDKAGAPRAAPDADLAGQTGEAREQFEDAKADGTGQLVGDQDSPQASGVQDVISTGASSDVGGPESGEFDDELAAASGDLDERSTAESSEPAARAVEEDAGLDSTAPREKNRTPAPDVRTSTKRAETPRSPRRPAPAEDAGEYTRPVPHVSTVDQEYARWNSAVVELLLLAKPAADNVYLCINPRILAWAFAEAGFDVLPPEEAEQRLSAAVGRMYRTRVLGHGDRLHVLRRCGGDGSPECAAFLAASVLAAYHMQSDEELSGNAYYRRLADLLGCGMSGAHPEGFSPPVFESLWVFLRNWLSQAHDRALAAPGSHIGMRRFVALPLAHVPLRSLDIEKLPSFFAWAGYEPGSRVRPERLSADLRLWQQSKSALTHTGAEAISDERSEAVLAQVSAELESWDGSYSESTGRRSALVEIQFDIVQRQPTLAYLPRRPPGFPSVFDDGEHVFEASDEGWYDPAPLHPADGEALALGFEWRSAGSSVQFALRRPQAAVIALTPSSNYSGFLSSRRLLRGVKCSVLCRTDLAETVEAYLSEAAQQRLRAVNDPRLPEGWSIIHAFTVQRHIEAPPELEALGIDSNIDLLVSGGLRIGRRWSWVAGAPPRVLVTGVGAGEAVRVNGAPVAISDSGELTTNGLLSEPGEYLIEAGRARRRIEIVKPRIAVATPQNGAGAGSVPVALPSRAWTLIGARPGEICRARSAFSRGALASCPFHPVWAVQVGAGPGADVAVLSRPEQPTKFDLQGETRSVREQCQRWAGVIYDAHVRRPRFVWTNGTAPFEGVDLVWRQYAAAAKQIKRAIKGR